MRINGRSPPAILAGFVCIASALAGSALSPSAAATQTTAEPSATDAHALFDRAVAFARSHPRARGRFQHTYLDRARSIELHNRGTFTVALPRARVELEGDEVRSIVIDETFARVVVPDGAAPLSLSFRLDTTPLPSLIAALGGSLPTEELFSIRRVAAEGDAVLELRPIDPTAMVDRIWLELEEDGSIARFLVVDTVGGTHRVVLEAVRYPAAIPDSAFALDVPAGATPIEP